MHNTNVQKRKKGKGCLALIALVMMGAAVLLGLVAAGASSGLLRNDPLGLGLLAVAIGLLGLLFFLVVARR